jgi:hypothetical protein
VTHPQPLGYRRPTSPACEASRPLASLGRPACLPSVRLITADGQAEHPQRQLLLCRLALLLTGIAENAADGTRRYLRRELHQLASIGS